MGGQEKNPWNKQKAKVENKGEDIEKYNSDADKRTTYILASTKKGTRLLLWAYLRRSVASNLAAVCHLNQVRP